MRQADTMEIIAKSYEETLKIGEQLGLIVKPQAVINLVGEHGCGKTVFVKGLAKGLKISNYSNLPSNSYVMVNNYKGKYELIHIDLFKAQTFIDIDYEYLNEILLENSIIAIEWADKLPKRLLLDYININFNILDSFSRQLIISSKGLRSEKYYRQIFNIERNDEF